VEVNVPVGSGLDVKAGQLISLLNWESGDGGAANPNFSQGNQWYFTGNGPAAGIQAGYSFTDSVDLKVRVQNGLYSGPYDSNYAKTVIASLGIKPCKSMWVNLIGFGGAESDTLDVAGASAIGGVQVTEQLGTGFEVDWFNFNPQVGATDNFWSVGGWIWYDFTSKVGVAFRAEYLDDDTGFGTSGLLGFPGNTGCNLYSLTATLNFKPTPHIKIQPELRYDGSSLGNAYDGKARRFIVGCGASYLF